MIEVSQTAEQATQTAIFRAQMSAEDLKLARMFMRLAFPEVEAYTGEDFEPAPLYISQAMACKNKLARNTLRELL